MSMGSISSITSTLVCLLITSHCRDWLYDSWDHRTIIYAILSQLSRYCSDLIHRYPPRYTCAIRGLYVLTIIFTSATSTDLCIFFLSAFLIRVNTRGPFSLII